MPALQARLALANTIVRRQTWVRRAVIRWMSDQCRKPFTVKVGTVFEASHVPYALLASGRIPHVLVQEGHFEQSASPDFGGHSQDRMVHVASHPRSDACCRRRADGR